jgi:hypothetical protein
LGSLDAEKLRTKSKRKGLNILLSPPKRCARMGHPQLLFLSRKP